ncbi:hypothetical protein LWC34_30300 [Kibdelosporangium philippinense]|uniref:Uncharacterized protein n=1 Tax=Kibdelosporangium philippinense TaxID=211113 RepID=A0ABS8ZGY4_9PSEU|nr:hypothetical protein [Kibdelosporangium philippinense]MCE7007088.1 hypothetical protein [Kibdelosporangium philippinense]
MATTKEIERRVAEADSARSARRTAAAKRIGELAQRRAAVAEQLDDIDRELGDVLATARDVIGIDELARFTDLPASDLTRWLEGRKTTRSKRKRSAAGAPAAKSDTSQGPITARTATARQASTPAEPAVPHTDTVDASARVPAEVT